MYRSRGIYTQGVNGLLVALLMTAVSGAYAQTLECATISKGGGVLPDGSVLLIGQPLVGKISNAQFTIELGAITCLLPAICGDNVVNQPSEQCDGSDNGACPGPCLPDCTCKPGTKVPTIPQWGLVGLGLLTVIGGAIIVGRRRTRVGFGE